MGIREKEAFGRRPGGDYRAKGKIFSPLWRSFSGAADEVLSALVAQGGVSDGNGGYIALHVVEEFDAGHVLCGGCWCVGVRLRLSGGSLLVR